jgi:hypothetical protein
MEEREVMHICNPSLLECKWPPLLPPGDGGEEGEEQERRLGTTAGAAFGARRGEGRPPAVGAGRKGGAPPPPGRREPGESADVAISEPALPRRCLLRLRRCSCHSASLHPVRRAALPLPCRSQSRGGEGVGPNLRREIRHLVRARDQWWRRKRRGHHWRKMQLRPDGNCSSTPTAAGRRELRCRELRRRKAALPSASPRLAGEEEQRRKVRIDDRRVELGRVEL